MKYIITIILTAVMVLSIGCDKGTSGANPLVGTWVVNDGSGNNYIFNDDRSGSIKFDDNDMEFTWSAEGDMIRLIIHSEGDRDGEVNYSLQGDVLELWNEGFPGKTHFNRQ